MEGGSKANDDEIFINSKINETLIKDKSLLSIDLLKDNLRQSPSKISIKKSQHAKSVNPTWSQKYLNILSAIPDDYMRECELAKLYVQD